MKFFSNQLFLIVATLILLAVFAFNSISYDNISNKYSNKETGWTLSKMTYAKATLTEFNKLQQLNIWNHEKQSTTITGKVHINWSLKGIVFEAEIPYALVFNDKVNKLQKYKVDALLPNSEKLTKISADSITFHIDGQTKSINLHEKPIDK